LDRQRLQEPEKMRDGKAAPFTFTEWAEKYPTFDDVKRKRSLPDEQRIIRLHLKPYFGAMLLLTEITREDGKPITKDMIQSQVEKAIREAKIKKFTFHCYRHTAKTEWARRGIPVEIAMQAAGLSCWLGLKINHQIERGNPMEAYHQGDVSIMAVNRVPKQEWPRRTGEAAAKVRLNRRR
jgi:hypothetical protein